jgi:hypothetical protein
MSFSEVVASAEVALLEDLTRRVRDEARRAGGEALKS